MKCCKSVIYQFIIMILAINERILLRRFFLSDLSRQTNELLIYLSEHRAVIDKGTK